jgi:hypothetical protein
MYTPRAGTAFTSPVQRERSACIARRVREGLGSALKAPSSASGTFSREREKGNRCRFRELAHDFAFAT